MKVRDSPFAEILQLLQHLKAVAQLARAKEVSKLIQPQSTSQRTQQDLLDEGIQMTWKRVGEIAMSKGDREAAFSRDCDLEVRKCPEEEET